MLSDLSVLSDLLDLDTPRFVGSLWREGRDPPDQLVLAAESDPLRSGRGVQLEVLGDAALLAGAPDGRLDGVEDGGGQEEGRLAHRFTGVDSTGVGHTTQ